MDPPDSSPAANGSWKRWHDEATPIRLGVSSCLLGEEVRYDGGHRRDRFVAEELGRWVEWSPVCPEVELGMGVPRPTIRLVDASGETRLQETVTGADHTAAMRAYAGERAAQLRAAGLDGYVLKRNSPSCGKEGLTVLRGEQQVRQDGVGFFAAELMRALPDLPVEEEGRLSDPATRERFLVRVFCRNRWRAAAARGWSRGRLVEFHTAHKLLLRAHHEGGYRELGRIVAGLGQRPDAEVLAAYEQIFQATLRHPSSVQADVNVLQHALGHLKRQLESGDKAALLDAIEDYRSGRLARSVPVRLLRSRVRELEEPYLLGQVYFDPYPMELMRDDEA